MTWEGSFSSVVREGLGSEEGASGGANPLPPGSQVHTYFPGLDHGCFPELSLSLAVVVIHTLPKNAWPFNEEFLCS